MKEDVKQFIERALDPIKDFMQIHSPESNTSQYYEIIQPLTVQKCTNIPDNVECQYEIEIFAPGSSRKVSYDASYFRDSPSAHRQNYLTLTYLAQGSLCKYIEGKRVMYSTGSCFLINKGVRHTENFDSFYQTINLSILPQFIESIRNPRGGFLFPDEKNELDDLTKMMIRSAAPDDTSKDYIDFVPVLNKENPTQSLFEEITETMKTPFAGATLKLQYLVCQLFGLLENPEYYHMNHIQLRSDSDSIIFSRISNMLEDSAGKVTRAEMERLLQYNGSYLSRIVKKHTGMSLTDYRLTFRIESAKNMLRFSDKSVAEIMQELNCTNRTFFYQIFKENCGLTPLEYRVLHNIDVNS